MNGKKLRIVDILLQTNVPVTSQVLSEKLEISSRTVKRTIWAIDEQLKENGAKILSSKNGYEIRIIDKDAFESFWHEQKYLNDDMALDNEIELIILKKLLLNKYYTQEQLCDETFVSRSSINNYIKSIKKILENEKIILSNRPHFGYYLIGNETDIRNYMVKLLFSKNDLHNIDSQLKNSSRSYSGFLLDLSKLLDKYGLKKEDQVTVSVMKYFIVAAHRYKNECYLEPYSRNSQIDSNLNKKKCEEIHKLFEDYYGIDLNEDEIIYLTYIMGSPVSKQTTYDVEFFENVINDFYDEILDVYQQDFSNDEILRKGLLQHLYACYSRMLINPVIDNPLIDIIKTKYVEAYNYAILCGNILIEKYNLASSENSLGYIALHFAAALERASTSNQFNIVLVCNYGYGMSELLHMRLKNCIRGIVVKAVVSTKELYNMDLSDIILVVTTVKLEKKVEKPVIVIDPFKLEEELESINSYLKDYSDIPQYKTLFSEDRFYPLCKCKNKNDTLCFITNELNKKGIISDENIDEIINREHMSSTEINKYLAMPHCIIESSKETFITVLTLEEPVLWGKENVQIILLCCIARNSRLNRKLFPLLYKLTTDEKKCEKLI